jgi:spore germination cell wall hydrolase CwlJ-like protein
MIKNTQDALSRSDRVLIAVLAVLLATASAAVGASLTYHPHTEHVASIALPASAPVAPQAVSTAPVRTTADTVLRQLLAEHRCLSQAMYYEARGEGVAGEKAVAEVVFHRMNHGDYGNSICAVVYEGAGHQGCQFSFTCNGALTRERDPEAWHNAEMLAAQILTGEVHLHDSTGGATSYHAVSVQPGWADTLMRTTQIGNHIFYRSLPRSRAS